MPGCFTFYTQTEIWQVKLNLLDHLILKWGMIEAKQLQKCSSVKLASPRAMIFVFALDYKTAVF